MSLIDEYRAMSPEERREFNRLQREADRPEPVVKQLGECMHGPGWNQRTGRYVDDDLTPEQRYDMHHPLNGIWLYGRTETTQVIGQDPVVRRYSDKEVYEHNAPIIDAWLEEKRKQFPDAVRPKVQRVSDFIG